MDMPLPEAGEASNWQRSGASTGTSATSGPSTRAHSSYNTQTTPPVPTADSHSYSHSLTQHAGSTSSSSSINTVSPHHSFSATAGPASHTAYSHSHSTRSRPVRHSRMPSREPPPPLPSSSWWQRFTGPSQVSQTAVARLMSAGFARAPARRALARTSGDIGAAMKLLQTEGDGVDSKTDKTNAKSTKGKHKDTDPSKSAALPQLQKRKSQRWSSSALKRNTTILSKPPRREPSLDSEPLPAPRREAFEHVRRPGLEPIPEPWVLLEPELEAGLETQFESENDTASRHLASPERVHRPDPPKLELAVAPCQPLFYTERESEAAIDDWDSESCSSYCSTDTFGVRGAGSGSASVVATTIGTPTSSAGCQQDYRVHQRYASGVEVWVVEVAKWPGSHEGAADTACSGTTTATAWTARTSGNGLSGRSIRSNRSERSTKVPRSTVTGSTTTPNWATTVGSSTTAFTSATAFVTEASAATTTSTKPSTVASAWLGEEPGCGSYGTQLYTDEMENDEDNGKDNILYW